MRLGDTHSVQRILNVLVSQRSNHHLSGDSEHELTTGYLSQKKCFLKVSHSMIAGNKLKKNKYCPIEWIIANRQRLANLLARLPTHIIEREIFPNLTKLNLTNIMNAGIEKYKKGLHGLDYMDDITKFSKEIKQHIATVLTSELRKFDRNFYNRNEKRFLYYFCKRLSIMLTANKNNRLPGFREVFRNEADKESIDFVLVILTQLAYDLASFLLNSKQSFDLKLYQIFTGILVGHFAWMIAINNNSDNNSNKNNSIPRARAPNRLKKTINAVAATRDQVENALMLQFPYNSNLKELIAKQREQRKRKRKSSRTANSKRTNPPS